MNPAAAFPARWWRRTAAAILLSLCPAAAFAGGASFSVTLDGSLTKDPVSGRVIVTVIGPGSKLPRDQEPLDGPFDQESQPIFALNVRGLAPGAAAVLDDGADAFPIKPSVLPPGTYRAQARLVVERRGSDWKQTPGNFYTPEVTTFTLTEGGPPSKVNLTLAAVTAEPPRPTTPRVQYVEVRSNLISNAMGRPVMLRAAVIVPAAAAGLPPAGGRAFPAVYAFTGFGGDYAAEAADAARTLNGPPDSAPRVLSDNAFWIVVDAESVNGHTLFVDSPNNGPWNRALVEELIPALQQRFPLINQPGARLLRGHSSGGWTALWLALNNPGTFGGVWASSPDPVDFRRFQNFDIYAGKSAFVDKAGAEIGSLRRGSRILLTVRQEVGAEEVLSPGATSGQQWASWQAAWGPRVGIRPAPLFDPVTGQIDPAVAEQYRRFDITARLRAEPDTYLPLFKERVRLICGTSDTYYLNEAVALLRDAVNELARPREAFKDRAAWTGYIKLVPGDHGSVFASPAMRAIPAEMVAELRARGYLPAPAK